MIKYNIEVTDTFGGEANYSWVKRYSIEVAEDASDVAIVRAAKKAAGWKGWRCNTERVGEGFEMRPRDGTCVIMFISYDYNEIAKAEA